jgi:DNA repair photolyase
MVMLKLPGNVRQVFEARLRETMPLTADRVLARTREVRGGRLNDPRFGSRQRGEGEYAEAIQRLFEATAKRLGLHRDRRMEGQRPEAAPASRGPQQLELFGTRPS